MATVDCTHPRANHQHGTHLAFHKDGCRCTPCTLAYRHYSKRSAYRTATGTHTYVDAERSRQHTQMLLDTLTVGQIQERSGVNRTAIRVLIGDWPGKPPTKRVTRKTEAALLAVSPDRVGDEKHGLVDATGTVRRLRALTALGWNRKFLTARLGASSRTTWLLALHPEENPLVKVATRDAVRELYDELSMQPAPNGPTATRIRSIARRHGWAPPLAWDDETIDDPAATPDLGSRAVGVDFDEFMFLLRTGETPESAAARCGSSMNTLQKQMDRAHRDDVREAIRIARILTKESAA